MWPHVCPDRNSGPIAELSSGFPPSRNSHALQMRKERRTWRTFRSMASCPMHDPLIVATRSSKSIAAIRIEGRRIREGRREAIRGWIRALSVCKGFEKGRGLESMRLERRLGWRVLVVIGARERRAWVVVGKEASARPLEALALLGDLLARPTEKAGDAWSDALWILTTHVLHKWNCSKGGSERRCVRQEGEELEKAIFPTGSPEG
jgi:hypothetical protein